MKLENTRVLMIDGAELIGSQLADQLTDEWMRGAILDHFVRGTSALPSSLFRGQGGEHA